MKHKYTTIERIFLIFILAMTGIIAVYVITTIRDLKSEVEILRTQVISDIKKDLQSSIDVSINTYMETHDFTPITE